MDKEIIKEAWKTIIREVGDNPDRIGMQDTPRRIANMYGELFRGYDPAQKPKVTTFPNGMDNITYDQMITDEGQFYSQCEHHGVPFFGDYYFAYIPSKTGKVLGLSKVARIVDYFSSKFQIQERLVTEVVCELWNELSKESDPPIGMALMMKAKHLCKCMRGAKKDGFMRTVCLKGAFKDKQTTREEFMRFAK